MSSEGFEGKFNTHNKQKWNVEKNYAPSTIPNQGVTTSTQKFQRRQNATRERFRQQEVATQQLKQQAVSAFMNVDMKRNDATQQRIENAQNYARRYAERVARFTEYVQVPSNCSPYLNMFLHKGMSEEQRMIAYNRHHMCPHRRKFTTYKIVSSTRLDGTKLPVYINPGCFCLTEHITTTTCSRPCNHCSRTETYVGNDLTYPGNIVYCTWCRFTQYSMPYWSNFRFDKTMPVQPTKDLTSSGDRGWEMPKRAEKQFGEMLTKPLMAFITHIGSMARRLGDWILSKVVDQARKTFISGVWDSICRLIYEFGKCFASAPITICHYAYMLLSAETMSVRLFYLALIFENRVLNNLIQRMLDLFGFGGAVSHWRHVQYEKEQAATTRPAYAKTAVAEHLMPGASKAMQRLISYGLGKIDNTLLADNNEDFQTEMSRVTPSAPFPPAEFDEIMSVDCAEFAKPARKEFGFSFLTNFFFLKDIGVGAKYLLNLVKDFNIAMSGWRNLHELVNNFLSYLPTWLTKLFVITDPRKRYGTDAQTAGNPVYEMVQAYKHFMRSWAVPSAFEDFKAKWRLSEEYITREYQPHRDVINNHRYYYTMANQVMSPGTLGSKPIPFVITLFGKPGTGKSSGWPVVLSGLFPNASVQQIRAQSYTRNPKAVHFDGYRPDKHKIFVFDDLGAAVDDEGANELMSIVSNADYLPPYASNDDPNVGIKGTSYDSPIVVICTNFEKFVQCHQIAEPTALQRRMGVFIHWDDRVSAKAIYKVEIAQPDGTRWPATKDDKTCFYTVKELQVFLARQYEAHMTSQSALMDNFNDLMVTKTLMTKSFDELYNSARFAYDGDEVKPARKEWAPLAACGYGLIIAGTYAFADCIDREGRALLDCIVYLASAFAIAWMAFKLFASPAEKESGESHTPKAKATAVFQRPAAKNAGEQDHENIINKIGLSHVVLVNENHHYVNGFFLKGRIVLTVKHFVRASEHLTIHTHRAQDTAMYIVPLSDCKVVEIDGADLCLIELPIHVQPFPDLTKYIAEKPVTTNSEGYVTRRTENNNLVVYSVKINAGKVKLAFDDDFGQYETCCDFTYNFQGKVGDCGNVVFAPEGGNLRIIGMHESSLLDEKNVSCAVALNRYELNEYCKRFSAEAQISRQMEFPSERAVKQDGELVGVNKSLYVCTTDNHLLAPGKTDLRKSEIFDQIQAHTMAPSILRPNAGGDPMANGLSKYSLCTDQFPADVTQQAVNSVTEELMALVEPDDIRRELTLDECLNGIPGVVESVDTTTSSGYPFSLDPRYRGPKIRVLLGEPGKWSLAPVAAEHYAQWERMLQDRTIPSDPFLATLKIEKRPLEKIRQALTRLFCAGSLTGFLFNKRYFGGFCAFFKRVRAKTFSTLGLDRGSLEWHELIERMREVGTHGLDGDQKEWDGRFKAGIAMQIVKTLFKAYYGVEGYYERYILFCHAVFAYLRVTWFDEDTALLTIIIALLGVMPSGWFLTFVINSVVNAVLMRTAWIILVSAPFNDLRYFRRFVRDKFAGDDNFLAVATAFLEQFNNITISVLFAQYGQKYTAANKSGELVPFKLIEDCGFCKLTTGKLFDKNVALFEMNANLEILNWIRKCDDPSVATEANCNDVLRNLFYYGEETFADYRARILAIRPNYNLIHFYSLKAAFLGFGLIQNPYGTFGYSRNREENPGNWKLLQDRNTNQQPIVFRAAKQSGIWKPTMNSTRNRTSIENEIKQSRSALQLAQDKMEKVEIALDDDPTPTARNELAQARTSVLIKFEKLIALEKELEKYTQTSEKHVNAVNEAFASVTTAMWSLGTQTSFEEANQLCRVTERLHDSAVALRSYVSKRAQKQSGIWKGFTKVVMPLVTLAIVNPYVARQLCIDKVVRTPHINWVKRAAKQAGNRPDGLTVEQPVAAQSGQPGSDQGSPSSLDDSTPQTTSRVGVHLSEQQQTTRIKPVDGNSKPSLSRPNAHLNETNWDLVKMLLRENLVGAFKWALSDAVRSEISISGIGSAATDVIKDLLKNALASSPFDLFQWFNCVKILVRFQLVASRFHQGRLGVYFNPTMLPSANVATSTFHPTRWTQLQHGVLDPSNGTIIEMEIPFRYHKGWVDLVFGDCLGQLHVQVLNQLQAAVGASPNVEVKVFVSFEGAQFRVPRPSDDSFVAMMERRANLAGYELVKKSKTHQGQPIKLVSEKEFPNDSWVRVYEPDVPQRAVKNAGFEQIGASLGGEIDALVADVLPKEITGAVAGVMMDKPAVTESPDPIVRKDAGYMTQSRGVEFLERFTMEPSAQYITKDQFGDSVDEMDIKFLLQKKVYYTTFNWAATGNVGDILFQTIVSPMHLTGEINPGQPFAPTPFCAIGNQFTYWRGSIKFFLEIAGTSFHEGRLDMCNHPAVTTVPASYVAAMSQYANSQTVRNTNNVVEIRIPFHSDIPWKRVWNDEPLSDTETDSAVRSMDYVTGSFSVRIAVPLKSPNNVSNNVDVNVYIAAGDDFEFHFMSIWSGMFIIAEADFQQRKLLQAYKDAANRARTTRISSDSGASSSNFSQRPQLKFIESKRAEKQAGDMNTDPKSDSTEICLGIGDVYTYDPPVHHFGESYKNLREMCKRYQTVTSQTGALTARDTLNRMNFSSANIGGFLGLMFQSYRLFRGPLVGKIQVVSKSTSGANNYDNSLTGFCTTNPQPALFSSASPASLALLADQLGFPNNSFKVSTLNPALVRFSDTQVGEFVIPFQSIYHSLVCGQSFDNVPEYYGNQFAQWEIVYNIMQYFSGDATKSYYVTLAIAFGDETRLGVFLGFPEMVRKETQSYPNPGS